VTTTILAIDDSPTILRVAQVVLARAGHRVLTASDGEEGLALARAERPDLVLLDFVMPRMNGYQVCKALTDDPATALIPVVLMSAQGDKVGDRFVQQLGVLESLSKPFTPDALLAAVDRGLERARTQAGRTAGNPGIPGLVDQHTAPARRFSVEELAPDPVEILSGKLAAVPLATLLPFVSALPLSGAVELHSEDDGPERVVIELQGGRVDFVSTDGGSPLGTTRIGARLVRRGALSATTLEAFLEAREPDASGLLGAALVEAGLVSRADLKAALVEQAEARLFDALCVRRGGFVVRSGGAPSTAGRDAALSLDVQAVLLGLSHRIDDWHLQDRSREALEVVYLRVDEGASEARGPDSRGDGLAEAERTVLGLVNGRATVGELARASRMDTLDFERALRTLRTLGMVRPRTLAVVVEDPALVVKDPPLA
jgi:CheY-like chemotaxis protein